MGKVRKVLLGFAAAFAVLVFFSVSSYREARGLAGGEHLAGLLLAAGVSRAAVVLAALLALLWSMAARERAEAELRLSRDEALREADGRRVAQEEAERLGESLRAVLDRIDTGVILVERDGRMSVFNRAAERIHGAWRDEIEALVRAGTHPPLRPDGKTAFAAGESPLARALKGESVRDEILCWKTPFRPYGYYLRLSAVPLHDHRGHQSGAVVMFTEIVAPSLAESPAAK
jgi:PAS domain-containing protein